MDSGLSIAVLGTGHPLVAHLVRPYAFELGRAFPASAVVPYTAGTGPECVLSAGDRMRRRCS